MIYRVTFLFSGGGEGFSETHLLQSTETNFNNLRAALGALAQARANLLGDPFYVWGIRISKYSTDGGVKLSRGVRLWKGDPAGAYAGWYNVNFDKANNGSEPSEVAIQAIGFTGPPAPEALQGNQNFTSLGAPPDAVVDDNGTVYPAKLGFGAAFNIWAGILTKANSGWGWGADVILVDFALKTATQAANGTVVVTTDTVIPNTVAVGQKYNVRFRDVNNGQGALNGEAILIYNGVVGGSSQFTTREVIGIPTAQNGGFCKVYKQVKTFVPYLQIDLGLVAIKHKRGKSPAARRGRAKRRIRG
jgi:hypothetical protein